MPNQDRIAQLQEYRSREKFVLADWKDREEMPASMDAVLRMRKEVERFTDFLIAKLSANVTDLQGQTQQFFKDWDNDDFTDDETEFIVEVEYEAMRLAGVKGDDLLI
jgi:hypothetical protein